MKMKTVAEVFCSCLENEGVECIFGLPGEENLDLLHALSGSGKIRFVVTRHEQGAAFMADVYGRLTGKPGVCLSTLGPGATNLFTGVADANMDRAPLVAITGQADVRRSHKESHQYINIVNAFAPITKWNTRIAHRDAVPEIIRKAFRIAQAEKPGATHIELNENVAKLESANTNPLRVSRKAAYMPEKEEIEHSVKLIRLSKMPVILAGNGAIRQRASSELIGFAESNNIPVFCTFMAKGVIPADHKLFVSTIGFQSRDYVLEGFGRADLVITVGYDAAEYSPEYWNPKRDTKIIHIDTTRAEVDENYLSEIELVGNIGTSLSKLAEMTRSEKKFGHFAEIKRLTVKEREDYRNDRGFPMKPQKIVCDLRSCMGRGDILISDVGMHKLWVARLYPAYEPNTVIISNGFASMGIALPGAIAAKLVHPEKKVVAVTGDGGFLMNCQELETAMRLGTAFVVVIFNDRKYAMIGWKQKRDYGYEFGIDFNNPDFVRLAESFGAKGYRIKKAAEFKPVLGKALGDETASIIDVPVDYRENFRLTRNAMEKL